MKKIKFVWLMALGAILFGFAGCASDDLGDDVDKKEAYTVCFIRKYEGKYQNKGKNNEYENYAVVVGTEEQMNRLLKIKKEYEKNNYSYLMYVDYYEQFTPLGVNPHNLFSM